MTQTSAQPLCTVTNLGACNPGDLVKMPVKLFMRRTFILPMSAADVSANFPSEFELFRATGAATATVAGGITTVATNLLGGDEVPCPFLLCGVCVQLTPEFDAWTATGAIVDSTAPGNTGPDTPSYDGTLPFAPPTTGRGHGTFEYGGATQRMAVDLLLSHRLRFLLQCKYELFDVPLSDIGCIDAAGNFQGSGDCLVPIGPGVQLGNAQAAAIGSKWRFLPPNVDPGPPPPAAPAPGVASAPTTRVMRGGVSMQGSLAGFYLCPAPILLAPCCRINMSLYQSPGDVYLDRARYEASDQMAAPKGYAPEWTSGVIAAGTAPVYPASPPGMPAAQVLNMKYGSLVFGITMIGYNVTLGVCQEYFNSGIPADLLAMYRNIPNVPGLAL